MGRIACGVRSQGDNALFPRAALRDVCIQVKRQHSLAIRGREREPPQLSEGTQTLTGGETEALRRGANCFNPLPATHSLEGKPRAKLKLPRSVEGFANRSEWLAAG
jgi:hypothetical protein